MGAVYGTGLLGHILSGDEDEQTKSETMTLFVSVIGTSDQIREVISERVGEWSWNEADEKYGFHWLDDNRAASVLSFARAEKHSAPYSLFSFLDEWHVLVPGEDTPKQTVQLPLPGNSSCTLRVNTLQNCIAGIQSENRRIIKRKDDEDYTKDMRFTCEEYLEFHEKLITSMKQCIHHKLVYVLGE